MLVEKMSKEELMQYVEGHKRKVKAQNESAKKNWDSVSCRLPKGTVQRVKNHGLTVNGLINRLVLQELERLDGGGNVDRQYAEEQQEVPLERPQEVREEDKAETVKESSKDDRKPAKKRDNAVVLAELQATVDRKRQEQEERKQKLEQEKEKRKEEEREQNRLEMRRYAESIRDRTKENQEQKEIVRAVLADPELLSSVLSQEGGDGFISRYGQEAYDEISKADKERRREETKQRERMRELDVEADQGEVPDFMNDL